jgi:hypothetical protein
MPADHSSRSCPEELILHGLLVLVGAIPVAVALAQRGPLGADATFGLLMVLAGSVGALFEACRVYRTRSDQRR